MTLTASTFRTAEPALSELLDSIHSGKVQLPDFQRGSVWDDNHIRSLIASISRSFPIGSVMLLENGGDGVRFKPRTVEGAPSTSVAPEQLILDGQQRMTSLYLALRSGKPVATRTEKGKDVDRYYYIDISACLDREADREDAVVSISPERVIRTNFNRDMALDLSARTRNTRTATSRCLPSFPIPTTSGARAIERTTITTLRKWQNSTPLSARSFSASARIGYLPSN